MSDIELRPYQSDSIESLRNGFREKHLHQVLAASTGAGKSIVAMSMLDAAMQKGSRVMFACDRRVLVDQFSRHLDRHGIDHGIYMAGHWRHRPHAKVQVASIQTLERMEAWPFVDLLIVDEIHAVMRKSVCDRLERNSRMRVIGLTATPFHPAIPKHFSNVVNVVTMRQLVDEGYLVPFRVFAATEIDTKGVKVVAGEWQKDELEARGLKVVGDVVSDYVKLTEQVFDGRARKTICFSSGVAHGTALVQQFAAAGFNFVQISYKDSDEYKADVLADFAKPDTKIQGVISSDILTRGFDQTDVEHVIVAKPLRKSFSMHVQIIGRGARSHPEKHFCIASGQRVLTLRGLVHIEKVLLSDRLWDGQSFVSHGGVINKGIQDVITYAGLTATPDHQVKTKEGWRPFRECADKQISIIKTGLGRTAIREGEDCFSEHGMEGREVEASHVCSLRMPNMFQALSNFVQQLIKGNRRRMQEMQSTEDHRKQKTTFEDCTSKRSLHEHAQQTLCGLWRQRNSISIFNSFGCLYLGESKPWIAGGLDEVSTRSDRQRRPLRARKPSLVESIIQFVSHSTPNASRKTARVSLGESNHSLCRPNPEAPVQYGYDKRTDYRTIPPSELQAKREVWDILNSGPRNSFTCEGLLVHNCCIQDNAGNWLRFAEDWETLYHDGVESLMADADSKTRKEPTEKEKKESRCPVCKHIWPAKSDVCPQCGHVRERRNMVEAVPGELIELGSGKSKAPKDEKQKWYSELLGVCAIRGWKEGKAARDYKEKFGVWPKGLDRTPKHPSPEVSNWVKSRIIAWSKSKAA